MGTKRLVKRCRTTGAREQVAPTSTTADRPGGAGPGSSEVAGSAKSYGHRGGGVFTGQSSGAERSGGQESGVSGLETDSVWWWREEARWGNSWRRKRHSNGEGSDVSGLMRRERKAEVTRERILLVAQGL